MGYMNSIAISCHKKNANRFKETFQKHEFQPDFIDETTHPNHIIFYFKEVKWNEYNCEIKEIMNLIKELFYNKEDVTYQRIGEDKDDYEELSNDWDRESDIIHEFEFLYLKKNK